MLQKIETISGKARHILVAYEKLTKLFLTEAYFNGRVVVHPSFFKDAVIKGYKEK